MSDESTADVAERMALALTGSKEDRVLLICDPERLIAMSVLASPETTMAEIESFAAMRSVFDEVLRAMRSMIPPGCDGSGSWIIRSGPLID